MKSLYAVFDTNVLVSSLMSKREDSPTVVVEKSPNPLRFNEKVVILQAVGRGNGMKNQWIIKT